MCSGQFEKKSYFPASIFILRWNILLAICFFHDLFKPYRLTPAGLNLFQTENKIWEIASNYILLLPRV